jgi:alpha-tubulin suppressor-like RCC1 family protein
MVSSGAFHSCAIAGAQSTLFCWGDNTAGRLGAAQPATTVPYPVPVSHDAGDLSDVIQVAAGRMHTCAVRRSGELLCWGEGAQGRLGDGVEEQHPSSFPAPVRRSAAGVVSFINDAQQVVAGNAHTCVLTRAATVECWGDNRNGQLGDGLALSARPVASLVPGLENVQELASGPNHTCALSAGDVYCWGDSRFGTLGQPGETSGTPVKVPVVSDATSLIAGSWFTCAGSQNGSWYCWGSNDSGQRGCSDASVAPSPLAVRGRLFGGYGQHLCAVSAEHRAICWGLNTYGQIGGGASDSSPQCVPTPVLPLSTSRACTTGESTSMP